MPVSLTSLPIQSSDPTHFVDILSNLLSKSECEGIIKSHTNLIPSNITFGTIRTREQFDDAALASLLWSRISHFYANDRIKDEDGYWWKVKGLNIHMRLSKYDTAGKFAPHYDYRRLTSLEMQSFMSVNIYLNDVPELHKGATRILQHPHPGHEPIYDTPLTVLGKIQPVQGTASIFRDTLWHDGEELLAGEKYLLRTDVMYEREGDFDFERVCKGLDGSAKANKALEISYALADGGNLPEAEAWRARAFTFHTDAWLLEKYSG